MSKDRAVDDAVFEQLPRSLRQQSMFERFHLYKPEIFQNRSRDPTFDPAYFPQNSGVVRLPCYWIARRHLYVFGDCGELGLCASEAPDGAVLFPIHPASVAHYRELLDRLAARDAAADGLRIWGVPTSSVRTFLAWADRRPEGAAFVKTSLHSPIFGDRHLYTWQVARSVGLSAMVHAEPDLPADLQFFPESLGCVVRRRPELGFIVRVIPESIQTNRLTVAPLFALMGGEQPLFLTLMEQARLRPLEFLEEVLCSKFARLWLNLSLRHGLILEAHAQDLMLAMTPDLRSVGDFYYRDFEGLQVDWELRRRRGRSSPANLPNASKWHETYAAWGYRYGQLVWYKHRVSLLQYLHWVLKELEQMLRIWQKRGLMGGSRLDDDALTAMFSRKMLGLIHELFAMRAAADYNIHHNLNRFVVLLLNVRKAMSARTETACAVRNR